MAAWLRSGLRRGRSSKTAVDNSDETTSNRAVDLAITSDHRAGVVEDTRTPVKRRVGLSEGIVPPTDDGSESPTKMKRVKKTPVVRSNKKQRLVEPVTDSPKMKPQRKFTSTPKTTSVMKKAKKELCSLIEVDQCAAGSSSTVTNDNVDISGIQSLPSSSKNKSTLFEGIVVFVDYKTDHDRSGSCIVQHLLELGAKIGKTFNLKVTHVVFGNGYRKTYVKAMERKIPLVAAKWIEACETANKIVDPIGYPPVGIEKYSKPKIKIPKDLVLKWLHPSDIEKDRLFKKKVDELMERVQNFDVSLSRGIGVTRDATVTSQETESTTEEDESDGANDIVGILSNSLKKIINSYCTPIEYEDVNDSYTPSSIKAVRNHLTPKGEEKKSSKELDSDILKIEDRLKLNSIDRQRFRKLLFPLDKELNSMSVARDSPSHSSQ